MTPPNPQIKNRTIFIRDNLEILRRIASESVDLIYLDPPFNKKQKFAAPVGSKAAGAHFKDTWTLSDTDDAWWGEISEAHPALYAVIHAAGAAGGKANKSYLIYMAIRLLEMRRVMKPSGSLYLHCDPTMSHPLKMALDAIFGIDNFRNEVIWDYKKVSNSQGTKFNRAHDVILVYNKSRRKAVFHLMFDDEVSPRKRQLIAAGYNTKNDKGLKYLYVYDEAKVAALEAAGKIDRRKFDRVSVVDTARGTIFTDVFRIDFLNPRSQENLGYPTQKPIALLERIIKASSDKDGLVLDPFCGCATACEAAEKLGRQWIGIDISPRAGELIRERLNPYPHLNPAHDVTIRTDLPGAGGKRSPQIKHVLFGKQEGFCNGCKHPFPFVNFEVDHIVPRVKGGSDDDENLQLLCGYCNRVKGGGTMSELLARLKIKSR